MIASPLIDELVAEFTAKAKVEMPLLVTTAQLGDLPESLEVTLRGISDDVTLAQLTECAATCLDLDEFQESVDGRPNS